MLSSNPRASFQRQRAQHPRQVPRGHIAMRGMHARYDDTLARERGCQACGIEVVDHPGRALHAEAALRCTQELGAVARRPTASQVQRQ
jgi:hypothetical protein